MKLPSPIAAAKSLAVIVGIWCAVAAGGYAALTVWDHTHRPYLPPGATSSSMPHAPVAALPRGSAASRRR